ncbi:hypothetical protein BDZ97DRAFT_1765520 [Flammula alnicola]|nr:hypothetical protein BDZ97DRAFT_1765520 [Flammula alnicola]
MTTTSTPTSSVPTSPIVVSSSSKSIKSNATVFTTGVVTVNPLYTSSRTLPGSFTIPRNPTAPIPKNSATPARGKAASVTFAKLAESSPIEEPVKNVAYDSPDAEAVRRHHEKIQRDALLKKQSLQETFHNLPNSNLSSATYQNTTGLKMTLARQTKRAPTPTNIPRPLGPRSTYAQVVETRTPNRSKGKLPLTGNQPMTSEMIEERRPVSYEEFMEYLKNSNDLQEIGELCKGDANLQHSIIFLNHAKDTIRSLEGLVKYQENISRNIFRNMTDAFDLDKRIHTLVNYRRHDKKKIDGRIEKKRPLTSSLPIREVSPSPFL